jgi:hypothetical protein
LECILQIFSLQVSETGYRNVDFIKNYKIKERKPPGKRNKRGKNLSPRNSKACHSISTALLQSVTEIGGTLSTMNNNRKTLHMTTYKLLMLAPSSICKYHTTTRTG